ncbi:restriction endonuclease subunit S [Gemmobacter caeruleus]|uniref:restriction endonuclease subunit S n=1 Tax=Gemmobacter caeruleus TaxID=2595004 RepID=UPI0011EF1004|nr:restriction endonuclease subunit S [Gemmobacter caeruleus]
MAELETVLLSSLLADDKAIAVGVMYPGEDTPSGVPLIRVADIVDGRISSTIGYRISDEVNAQYRRTQLAGNEVLMTLVGRPGIAIKVPPEMGGWNVARALAVLRLADPEERDFFVYAVASPQVQHTIRNWCNTTVQATLNLKEIKALPLPWPDRKTRRAIAATLGALDDKIELNRKMNATLEAMARALFRDWFVDFGPTRAKMAGAAPYLSPDLWSLFPDRLDAEGKPEGWEVSTIGDFIELLDHKRVPLSSQERAKRQGPYPYHGATSVMDHIDNYLFDERLLLLGEDGSVAKGDGRPFTQYVWGKLWVNNHAHVIKGRDLSVEQLKLFFDQIDIRPFVTGAVQPKLNQANLRRVPYLRASDTVHSAFDATIAPLYDLVRQLNEESRTLAQTRDLLLPRLMSGEVRVADAVAVAKEMA